MASDENRIPEKKPQTADKYCENTVADEPCLISVIIPAYNEEAYVDQCIASVVDQTYRNLEIILIDDGSTDGTLNKLLAWADSDNRILCHHQTNKGLSASRNYGIQISKGRYVTFIDSDDALEPDYIETLFDSIQKNSTDLAIAFFDRPLLGPKTKEYTGPNPVSQSEGMELLLNGVIPVNVFAKLYTRELLDKVRFVEGMVFEDNLFMYQIIHECRSISLENKIIYHHLIREGSICITVSDRNIRDRLKSQELVLDFLDTVFGKDDYRCTQRRLKCWRFNERMLYEYPRLKDCDKDLLLYIRKHQDALRERILSNIGPDIKMFRKLAGNKAFLRYEAIKYMPGLLRLYIRIKVIKRRLRHKGSV